MTRKAMTEEVKDRLENLYVDFLNVNTVGHVTIEPRSKYDFDNSTRAYEALEIKAISLAQYRRSLHVGKRIYEERAAAL